MPSETSTPTATLDVFEPTPQSVVPVVTACPDTGVFVCLVAGCNVRSEAAFGDVVAYTLPRNADYTASCVYDNWATDGDTWIFVDESVWSRK